MLYSLDAFLLNWLRKIIDISPCDAETPESVALAKFFLFLLLLACGVYARALFFPVLGIDTYTYALSEGHGDIYFEIVRGTWGFTALNQLVPGPLVSPLVSMLFFLLTTSVSVFLVVVFWTGTVPDWKAYATGAIMVLFPYWASQAYFGYYHYGYSLATLTGVLSVLLPWHSGGLRRCAVAGVCFALGASFYQGSVTIASGLVGASLLIGFINRLIGYNHAHFSCRSLARVATVLFTAGLVYLLAHKIVMLATHMPTQNNGYVVDLNLNFNSLLRSLSLVVPGSPLLLPRAAAWLMGVPLAMLCVSFSVIMRNDRHDKVPIRLTLSEGPTAARSLLWLFFFFALAVVSPVSLALVQSIDLHARSTGSVAFVWGAVFLIAALLNKGYGKKILMVCTVLLCLLFASRINYLWHIQSLATEADMADARLMYQQVISLPEFSRAPKPVDIAFVGCLAAETRAWPQDYDAIFGLSQFTCFGSSTWPAHAGAVLRFVGGQIKTVPVEGDDLIAIANRKPWPAVESVFWNQDRFVIWLGTPQRHEVAMKQRLQWVASALGLHGNAYASPGLPMPRRGLLQLVQQGLGPWESPPLRSAIGHVDDIAPIEGDNHYLRVRGWAFDLASKMVPQYVALITCDGKVAGLAATGIQRKDLHASVATDAEYAGFEGFVLVDQKICNIKY